MRYCRGFTLIEVMIVVVIVALLATVGYPSYRDHIARGQRSQGEQFLSDLAQRQEQIMLDQRQYFDTIAALNLTKPDGLKYGDPNITLAGPPPTFTACMSPVAGSYLATKGDGDLCLNSVGDRWRETDGNRAFNKDQPSTNCAWSNRSCAF